MALAGKSDSRVEFQGRTRARFLLVTDERNSSMSNPQYNVFDEENLQAQARYIDGEVVRLQARVRGFLLRLRISDGGKVTPLSISVSIIPRPVGRSETEGCNAEENDIVQIQDSSIDHDSNGSADSASEGAKIALQVPDFAQKRFSDLPDGWLLARMQHGDFFFVQTATNNSTWTHPRQNDAHQ